MPKVAEVDGVAIRFYADEHPPPHFHAVYAEHVAQIQITPPLVLKGSLPPAKLRAILAWTADNRAFFMDVWSAFESRRKPGGRP